MHCFRLAVKLFIKGKLLPDTMEESILMSDADEIIFSVKHDWSGQSRCVQSCHLQHAALKIPQKKKNNVWYHESERK